MSPFDRRKKKWRFFMLDMLEWDMSMDRYSLHLRDSRGIDHFNDNAKDSGLDIQQSML